MAQCVIVSILRENGRTTLIEVVSSMEIAIASMKETYSTMKGIEFARFDDAYDDLKQSWIVYENKTQKDVYQFTTNTIQESVTHF